jgi:PAS domain S-box-containing protein
MRKEKDEANNETRAVAVEDRDVSYRLLVDSVQDYAIFMLDPDGQVTTWNVGAQRIKGYTPEDIIGQHFSVFYTPEDQEKGTPEKALETARREGRVEMEGWRVRRDGGRFWASVVLTAIHDEGGELRGFVKVTRDLTERKQAEEKLLRAYRELEKMVEDGAQLNHELHELTKSMAGREYRIRELENEVKLLRLRLELAPPLIDE